MRFSIPVLARIDQIRSKVIVTSNGNRTIVPIKRIEMRRYKSGKMVDIEIATYNTLPDPQWTGDSAVRMQVRGFPLSLSGLSRTRLSYFRNDIDFYKVDRGMQIVWHDHYIGTSLEIHRILSRLTFRAHGISSGMRIKITGTVWLPVS